MKAYKGFRSDLTCYKHFKYEIGNSYEEPEAILCLTGFHACTNPLDVFRYYSPLYGSRFCEVEAEDTTNIDNFGMRGSDSKISAKKIRIVRELSVLDMIDEFRKMTPGNGVPIRTDRFSFSVSMSDPDVRSIELDPDIIDTIKELFEIDDTNNGLQHFALRIGSFNDDSSIDMMRHSNRPFSANLVAVLNGNRNHIMSDADYNYIISVGDHAQIELFGHDADILALGTNTEVLVKPSVTGLNHLTIHCVGSNSKIKLYGQHIHWIRVGGAGGTEIEILADSGEIIRSLKIDSLVLRPHQLYELQDLDSDNLKIFE